MFSMCSELTPRAHIPDTRIPQLMQPCLHILPFSLSVPMKQGIPSGWTGGKCPKFVLVFGIFFILFVLADQARVGRYRRRGKSVRITSERVINGKSRLSEWLTKHNEYLLPPSFIRQTLCRANIFHPIWCWFTEFGNRNWFWKSDLEDAPLFLTVGESSTKL